MEIPDYIKRLFSEVKPPPNAEPFSSTVKQLVHKLDNVGNSTKGN